MQQFKKAQVYIAGASHRDVVFFDALLPVDCNGNAENWNGWQTPYIALSQMDALIKMLLDGDKTESEQITELRDAKAGQLTTHEGIEYADISDQGWCFVDTELLPIEQWRKTKTRIIPSERNEDNAYILDYIDTEYVEAVYAYQGDLYLECNYDNTYSVQVLRSGIRTSNLSEAENYLHKMSALYL